MDCTKYADNLTAYLDGELADRPAKAVESHLGTCTSCAKEFTSLKEAGAFIDSRLYELSPSPELWQGIRSQISTVVLPEKPAGFLQLFQRNRWLTATAVSVVFLVGFGIWKYTEKLTSDEELNRYMAQYVQTRESEEDDHRKGISPVAPTEHEEFLGNPFVTVSQDLSSTNPFRETAR